jgi:glutathione S-transferase
MEEPGMLTIYGVYRSRATRNIWLAMELGIPFKQVPVIQANRLANPKAADAPLHTRSPEFMKINPNGHVPCIDDDGLKLCESMAINLYLAKKHGGPLGPANVREDGEMSQWSVWAVTEIEGQALLVMQNRVAKPPAERNAQVAEKAVETLRAPFAVLDAHLANADWIVGNRFTVADINVAEIVRYAQAAPELFEANPRVKAWLARCQSRPKYKEMMAKRDAEPA